jgi:serine/threonine protein kinase
MEDGPNQGAMNSGEWTAAGVLSDRYRIAGCVQRSATCTLYRTSDVFRDETHLVLRPSFRLLKAAGAQAWFERFCKDALTVPSHEDLLTCRRLDRHEGVPYLIMDDFDGQTWEAVVRDGQLADLHDMIAVAIRTARGLAWLHDHDHVHANLKPANVLIGADCRVKVFKYGETAALTRAFASPEQLAPGQGLTPATDMWSWAASVLYMFVGIVNWPDGLHAPAALDRYLRHGPAKPDLALLPVQGVELLRHCFEKKPTNRPKDMHEVLGVVEKLYENVALHPFDDRTASVEDAGHVVGEESAAVPHPPQKLPERKRFDPGASNSETSIQRL